MIRKKRKLPKPWEERPRLSDDLKWIYNGFWEVSTERPPSFGGFPFIPITKIHQYCRDMDIDGERKEIFIYCINAMDTFFVDYSNNKAKK